jgi:hypothetical protein
MTGANDRPDRRADERPARLEVPHRMRRLTDTEMDELENLAAEGRNGPVVAMDRLWDLILQEIEGVTVAEATAQDRRWLVQNYAIPDDQSKVLFEAFVLRRKGAAARGSGLHWLMWSPATFDELPPDKPDT